MAEDRSVKKDDLPIALNALYDQVSEFTDDCFFFCDALEGMLSTEYALARETLNGICCSTERMKRNSRGIRNQLKEICRQTGKTRTVRNT